MSRIKSSTLYTSDLSIKSVETYLPTGVSRTFDHSISAVASSLLTVPDITVNPKGSDGYRQPSDYSMSNRIIYPSPSSRQQSGFLTNVRVPFWEKDTTSRNYRTVLSCSGDVVAAVYPAALPSQWALTQELRMKILNNIKDEKFNVAMLLAEIGKTANTAANLMLRIGRSMDLIRRRKPETFAYLMHGRLGVDNRRPTDKFLREASGTFLEWKYGIMPSVYDLEGITKSLDTVNSGSLFDNPPLMVARASVKSRDDLDIRFALEHGFGENKFGLGSCNTSMSARADFTVDAEGLRGLSEYGIGLTTVATVAYDLTPFSFVANMVVPMAELISAWGALAGVNIKGYSETSYHEYSWPEQRFTAALQRNAGRQVPIVVESSDGKTFTRSGSTTVPFPIPFVRNPVKVGNVSTVLALFTQLRKKPVRPPRLHGFDNKDL